MVERVVSPVLVGREEELAVLEGALLATGRFESRFVILAGEAGIGKTRLATELARQARRLDAEVLWGSCSEAELALPYLPFVEAIGNFLGTESGTAAVGRLRAERRELAQLFPQLSEGEPDGQTGDPARAKLRLFEAFVSLLTAIDRPVVIVIEDVHWADESTRELLDHLARRLRSLRALLLVTYRSDELHRKHALLPVLQTWRRSRTAEIIELEALPVTEVSAIISAIFDADDVGEDFAGFMRERSEGNPFVLEEMLKEALERGDIFRTDRGWDRKSVDELGIPSTVRDTIRLRLQRLDNEVVIVLQAAAVLGRTFDYPTLTAVADVDDAVMHRALDAALQQQLVEEEPGAPGRYWWRHALTQEAISSDTVTPRRQQLHGRAADALLGHKSSKPIEIAHHLLEAGRFVEAVPMCIRSADDAERATAFREAVSLLERALPHVTDEAERARIACRVGRDYWLDGDPSVAEKYLEDGIDTLEALGETLEAARSRVVLGRCRWERLQPELALEEYVRARDVLETAGPSAELAMTYMRIAGLRTFELDDEGCVEAARHGAEIAEAIGADFERIWARSFEALGLAGRDVDAGLELLERCYREAAAKGYWMIAANLTWNEIWTRVHLLQGELDSRRERLETIPEVPLTMATVDLGRSYVAKAQGNLPAARADAERAGLVYEGKEEKMRWRAGVQLAEVLLEEGKLEEAKATLPPVSSRTELQDIVYDATARIRLHLAAGETDDAVWLAREILSKADRLAAYRETLAVGVEAFVAAGRLDEAEELIEHGRAHPNAAGLAFLDEAQGRMLLARGDHANALVSLRRATSEMERVGHRLVALRARVLLAAACAHAGLVEEAEAEFRSVCTTADQIGARLIADEARARAAGFGITVPAPEPLSEPDVSPQIPLGERLVTSLFADVRGSTALGEATPPQELAERLASLYRFAKSEVTRHHGIVDKFAGDAVMATFNASGVRLDHCVEALEAAFTLRDKAALTDLPVGIGIAVGPAILAKGASQDNIAVRGAATNLAARLQAAAGGGEIVLSEEAHRRVEPWLAERRVDVMREELTLKGFDRPQVAYRIREQRASR